MFSQIAHEVADHPSLISNIEAYVKEEVRKQLAREPMLSANMENMMLVRVSGEYNDA